MDSSFFRPFTEFIDCIITVDGAIEFIYGKRIYDGYCHREKYSCTSSQREENNLKRPFWSYALQEFYSRSCLGTTETVYLPYNSDRYICLDHKPYSKLPKEGQLSISFDKRKLLGINKLSKDKTEWLELHFLEHSVRLSFPTGRSEIQILDRLYENILNILTEPEDLMGELTDVKHMEQPDTRMIVVERIPDTGFLRESSTGAVLKEVTTRKYITVGIEQDGVIRFPTDKEIETLKLMGIPYEEQ